ATRARAARMAGPSTGRTGRRPATPNRTGRAGPPSGGFPVLADEGVGCPVEGGDDALELGLRHVRVRGPDATAFPHVRVESVDGVEHRREAAFPDRAVVVLLDLGIGGRARSGRC